MVQDDGSRTRAGNGWGSDGFFFTEAARGGPLTWRVGGAGFEGDALGPVRHAHDGAAEYYFMVAGSIVVEVGGEERVLEENELCYIAPDAPHNVPRVAGDGEARMFCVVGPNRVDAKWRLNDFVPGSEARRQAVARPFVDDELPAGGTLRACALTLSGSDAPLVAVPEGEERVYLVVDGALDVSLHGGLHGTLRAGTYLHVREGLRHEMSSTGECRVLEIGCASTPWAGVPVAREA